MKLSKLLSIATLLFPLVSYTVEPETEEEDYTVGYKVSLENKTDVPLQGSIEFELINNNKHPITIPGTSQVNGKITHKSLQLITQDGKDHGIVSLDAALKLARAAHLDLVVTQDRGPLGVPVAKVMDYKEYSTFTGYGGKVGEHLTAGEKSIIGKAGQAIGAAASAYAGSKDVELPEGTADATGGIATEILNWFNACLKGFSVVYKGYEYKYKFGNGCVDQEFTIESANKGTELRIFDANGNVNTWGSKMRVSKL